MIATRVPLAKPFALQPGTDRRRILVELTEGHLGTHEAVRTLAAVLLECLVEQLDQ